MRGSKRQDQDKERGKQTPIPYMRKQDRTEWGNRKEKTQQKVKGSDSLPRAAVTH